AACHAGHRLWSPAFHCTGTTTRRQADGGRAAVDQRRTHAGRPLAGCRLSATAWAFAIRPYALSIEYPLRTRVTTRPDHLQNPISNPAVYDADHRACSNTVINHAKFLKTVRTL